MALLIPSLDDRTYEQLAEVLRRQIPPEEWTDHNPSDPGMMLIELLCWLGEMTLYRMDRVPETHRAKFLDFIIDPPEPVTVELFIAATFGVATPTPPPTPTETITIPAGTRFATDYVLGRRFVFETFRPLLLNRPPMPFPQVAQGSVTARAILEVFDEVLGTSNNTPHQTFALRPPRIALGITDPDHAMPILTDFVHRTAAYEPNPRVRVGVTAWTPVPSLRTERSHVSALNPALHYMIEPHESRIRFGDGTFGAIPAAGAQIVCTRYAVLEGTAALRVREHHVRHMLNFSPPTDVSIVLDNTDAEGGAHFFPVSQRFARGLGQFRAPYRLVTPHDFERAVLEDFNQFQRDSASTPQIARASVDFNRRPVTLTTGDTQLIDAPGYVTLMLIADAPNFETQFRNETVTVAAKQALVDVPDPVWQRLRRFLDPRRLITTRLVRHTPELVSLTMTATVVIARDRSVPDMQETLRTSIYDFLSVLRGDFDGQGWRLGRDVYRSQLFRLLEDIDGVDHVDALVLSPADAQGNVAIDDQQLPVLQTLTLTLVRA